MAKKKVIPQPEFKIGELSQRPKAMPERSIWKTPDGRMFRYEGGSWNPIQLALS